MRTTSASRAAPTRWNAAFWSALLGVVILRSWFATTLPLSGDEAYHWEWSRHLAPGYHDHRDGRELRAFHLVRCEGFDGEPASFP